MARCYLGAFSRSWPVAFMALQTEAFSIVDLEARVRGASLVGDVLLYLVRSYCLLGAGVQFLFGLSWPGAWQGPLLLAFLNLLQASLYLEWVYWR